MQEVTGTMGRILGWGAFLACSWTWCIGMWLPAILMRDYGPLSFILFALPNCIGAAGMGILLKHPGRSDRITELHAGACAAFSGVTNAFQWFFAAWLLSPGEPGGLLAPMAAALVAGVAYVGLRRNPRVARLSLVVWIASLLLLGYGIFGIEHPVPGPPPSTDLQGLAFLFPVIAFGFLLCPYLDRTFHRARRALPGDAGNSAFVIGFMALFWMMIFGTWFYAQPAITTSLTSGLPLAPSLLAWPVLLHIGMQLGFTIAAHHASVPGEEPSRRFEGGILLLAAPIGVLAAWIAPHLALGSYSGGEVVYRLFMGFYGLIFPAYVWLCVIPRSGPVRRPSPRSLLVFVGAVLAAGPCFVLGFLMDQEAFLAPGLGIVLLARLLIPATPAPRAHELRLTEPTPARTDQGSLA